MIPKLLRLCAKHSIGPRFPVILNNVLSQQVSTRSLLYIIVLLASLTLLDSKAAVTLTETVYQNAIGDIAGVYSKTQEYGDQIILAGDSNHVISFYFEYNGQFEADHSLTIGGIGSAMATIASMHEPIQIFQNILLSAQSV